MVFARLLVVPALITALFTPAIAQLPELSDPPTFPSVPESLSSARATMETFLTAMNEDRVGDALGTMDLSAYGAARDQEGRKLAHRLLDIMNKTEFIVLSEVPDETDGDPYAWQDFGELGSIAIAPGEDGAWRFTRDSVTAIDGIWQSVRNKRTIDGLSAMDLYQVDPAAWLRHKFPDSWHERSILGARLWQAVAAVGLVLLAFIAGALIRLITRVIVRSSLHIPEEIADKRQIKSLGRSLGLIVNVAFIGFGLPFLGVPFYIAGPTLFVLKLLNAFAWIWLLSVVWDIFVGIVASRASESKRATHKVVVPVVSKLGRFFIFVGVLVFFIAQLGYNVSALLAGLGLGGLVFALAAKDSVENFLGSVTILMEMPFGVGDWVKIGDIDGEVEEINLRSTRIRTFKDSLITMPNSRMITSHVENLGVRRHRRLTATLGIEYETPADTVAEFCARLRTMLLDHPQVWDDKRYVYLNEFDDSTLNVMLYCFIIAPSWQKELEYRDDILRRILSIAHEMGVNFAYPTRKIVYEHGSLPAPAAD